VSPAEEMDSRFEPGSYEAAWQRRWARAGYFRAEAPSSRPSYCIMIPPPNVTGKLHMGHALQGTLEDTLTRWRRMRGDNALWLPGTDHAGIATQLMVERQLATEGTTRQEIGRERFVARLWEWTELHHGNIREQYDQLGASCDWSRERFTLDPALSRAVREAFVRLYDEKLIYRGDYIVNWSPTLGTAISDLEVESRTIEGKLYYIAYPLADSDERIVVATTRPETMLGDTAVAYHPEDERYRALAGRFAVLPLVGRRLPLVADVQIEPEFGTGLVKITPFHDPFDFELARRHQLPGVAVINQQGQMTAEAGADFAGLDRFAARERVLARLREGGFLVREEPHSHNVGHSQRSGEPVEPLVSTQWFCDVSGMAEKALAAQRDGRLRIHPESWDKTWEHWLSTIRPWCISRQLWWGHQIPAWYDETGQCYVARTREEAEQQAGTTRLTQDPDVLDTWFSSGLWPFSTLGWPDPTPDLATFYPTSTLVTGYDILFFWVARMVMSGLHFTGQVPFAAVHLTGLIRDAEGQKMSKTRGNTVDPATLIEQFGADALRFTLASLDSPGRDVPINLEQLAGYRAFGNKIWNAARFALGRVEESGARVAPTLAVAGLAAPERWILSRLSRIAGELDSRLEGFRFDEVCNRLYHFFWDELCSWYIELAKPALTGEAPRERVPEVLLTVLDRSLRLLHPVMPFITEELWQRLPGHEAIHPETICLAPYPQREPAWEDAAAEAELDTLMQLVTRIRALRTELGIAPRATPDLAIVAAAVGDAVPTPLTGEQQTLLRVLCHLGEVRLASPPAESRRELAAGFEFGLAALPLGDAEREKLSRELAKLDAEIARAEQRLADPQFVAKAPAAVVAGGRSRVQELHERRARLVASLGTPTEAGTTSEVASG
jgi:valyl-tRNA synthetase